MKKIILITICIVMSIAICTGFCLDASYDTGYVLNKKTVTMYAADGRTLSVKTNEIEAYKNVGWYIEPVTIMYAMDGRTLVVANREIEAYKNVGWYVEPTVVMYAADGRTLDVKRWEIELYQSVGWYIEPVTIMYAVDGRTLVVAKREIEAYKNVGWYISPSDFPAKYQPMVALTFDDGPSKFTNRIVDCLVAHNAKATFFVVGKSALAYPDVLKRTADAGMEIGSHTMTHPRLTSLSVSGIKNELQKVSNTISSITGTAPTLLRPPYGSYNKTVGAAANMPLILWSIDTLDWKTRNAEKTINSVLKNVKDGSVILMHDLYSQTADAAEKIIPALINKGYRLVTVSELAKAKDVALENGKSYSSFKRK